MLIKLERYEEGLANFCRETRKPLLHNALTALLGDGAARQVAVDLPKSGRRSQGCCEFASMTAPVNEW